LAAFIAFVIGCIFITLAQSTHRRRTYEAEL
jgi:hypothetical protein